MTPAASDLLSCVRKMGADLEPIGDHLRVRASAPLPPDLVAALRSAKGELINVLLSVRDLGKYWQRLGEAQSWDDLYGLLADAEVDYAAGELSGDEVEGLAVECARKSRRLPEHRAEVEE
jgi:hypothetical protein